MTEPRIAHRICPLCEAMCGMTIHLVDDRAEQVRGNDGDLFSGGFICPKGTNFGALDSDPDRLTVPLVRRDGRLVEVTWDEAFAAVREGFARVRAEHGPGAFALYRGNPSAHTFAGFPLGRALGAALGSEAHLYTASTADQMPTHVAAGMIFGSPMAIPVPDIDRTDYLLILGANPMVSNGSLMSAPDMPGRLRALRARGGRLTVVDPRRTDTARRSDRHLPIRPGTDPYLLLALIQVLAAEDRIRLGAAAGLVDGIDDLLALAAPFTPEAVEDVCGVAAGEIRSVARELSDASSAAVYSRIGVCTVEHGTVSNWLVMALNVLTGNLDRPGGVMFPVHPTRPAYLPEQPFRMGRRHSRVRGLPEVIGEFPVATMADEMETPGEGQLRALVTIAGNPVLSAPNGERIGRALAGLDFMVSVDPYLNETTRHAHVILPPPRPLQSGHYDWLLSAFTVRAVIRFSPPAVPLEPGQLSEADILVRLTALAATGEDTPAAQAAVGDRLVDGLLAKSVTLPGSPVQGRDPADVRAQVTGETVVERHLDVLLRVGPFGDGFGANPEGLTLERLRAHPEGIDFGPMVPRLTEVIAHTDGRIALCPAVLLAQAELLAGELSSRLPTADGMVLIGRRALRSNNSWMHNLPNLVGGSNRCTLQLSPQDAVRLGIGDGDKVRVRSAVGEVVVPAEHSDAIRSGVVSLPHGWGHDVPDVAMDVARAAGGVNANALTDDSVLDAICGNAVFNGVPVVVELA